MLSIAARAFEISGTGVIAIAVCRVAVVIRGAAYLGRVQIANHIRIVSVTQNVVIGLMSVSPVVLDSVILTSSGSSLGKWATAYLRSGVPLAIRR
jgi:uncharacterized membrane protein